VADASSEPSFFEQVQARLFIAAQMRVHQLERDLALKSGNAARARKIHGRRSSSAQRE
jgi:hypothetical protein